MNSYDEIIKIIILDEDISEKYKVNARSDFFEGSIVQSFGIEVTELKLASFFPPKQQRASLVGAYTDFQLGITPEQVEQLVNNINLEFPDSAEIIAKGYDKQHIAIKHQTLVDPKFWEKIKAGLNYISENHVDLFKTWQEESIKRNKEIAKHLNWVISNYEENDQFCQAVHALSQKVSNSLLLSYDSLKASADEIQSAIDEKIASKSPRSTSIFKETDVVTVNDDLYELNNNLKKLNINTPTVPLLH